ncbi:related to glutathione transferase omega-1 [Rhynchosporium agropyri]|uniref:Related to glutathione transferase omega-1 n=1 Tax=Rhynchosporium agropyri TaxID=914238 RepID=A0A1E1JRT5_9HELO|nr:related to glutathione transferase omega-1 [Rhynchosporium agropyri]
MIDSSISLESTTTNCEISWKITSAIMGNDHPDSKLFPHATGAAAQMVKEHEGEEPLKLFSGWVRSSTPLASDLHIRSSVLSSKERCWFSWKRIQYESTVICEFLEEAYPSATPHLMPSDPYTRARTRIWTDFVTPRIIPAFHPFLQCQPSSSANIDDVRGEFLDKLREFTQAMDPDGPYFLGKEVSMIDLILAPWAIRLWVFDHFKGGLNIPEGKIWDRWGKCWVL